MKISYGTVLYNTLNYVLICKEMRGTICNLIISYKGNDMQSDYLLYKIDWYGVLVILILIPM